AEDLVAINATHCIEQKIDYVIAGIDHDLDQIPGKHYNFKYNRHFEITEEEAEFNLHLQLVMGCPTDKIEGVKGYGKNKAKALLSSGEDDVLYESSGELYRARIINLYVQTYGLQEGISRFTETFNLVYLLRKRHEVIAHAIAEEVVFQ